MFKDHHYLCQGLGHLTGLETRIFHQNTCIEHYRDVVFDPDPVQLIQSHLHKESSVYYVETEDLLVFGIVQDKGSKDVLVIGPTAQIRPDKHTLLSLLTKLNQPIERIQELQNYFNSVVAYPFENFLQILCFLNYALNDEQLNVSDLITEPRPMEKPNVPEEDGSETMHNTYQMERDLIALVKHGNVEAIRLFMNQPVTGRIGLLAHNELRQRKNGFIVAATLISRAAIEGGLSTELAFAISDRYIQKVELLSRGKDIAQLTMTMLLDYTQRVEALQIHSETSILARTILRYIRKNISKKISLNELANHVYMNRSYLCERFKEDTSMTISHFIRHEKIQEAKRLIETTDLSFSQISDYLAFSSQSHFQSVFKDIEHLTPNTYKSMVTKNKE